MTVITLLTDFGTADGYVAEMKGVLCGAAPDAVILDLSHDIGPQDVEMARLAVARYWQRFPAGTVHLVVVDPAVGSSRAALAAFSEGRFLVGPDNGVLSPALLVPTARAVQLPVPAGAASTFHGRDVFAPAAAALARGAPLESLGSAFAEPSIRRTPEPVRDKDGVLRGEVIAVDHFGNAVTNLVASRAGNVEVAGRTLAVRRTYMDADTGEALGVVGSHGLIEIAVRDGHAASLLGITRGAEVRWRAADG
jgi:hypothetical protein